MLRCKQKSAQSYCRATPVQQPQGVEFQDVVLDIDDHLGPPLFTVHDKPGNIFKFTVIIP